MQHTRVMTVVRASSPPGPWSSMLSKFYGDHNPRVELACARAYWGLPTTGPLFAFEIKPKVLLGEKYASVD